MLETNFTSGKGKATKRVKSVRFDSEELARTAAYEWRVGIVLGDRRPKEDLARTTSMERSASSAAARLPHGKFTVANRQ